MNKSYEDLERLISECKLMLNKRDEEIDALKAERDALAAQVQRLVNSGNEVYAELQQWALCESHEETEMAYKAWLAARSKTPQQCLRDVQAEAGRAGFVAGAQSMKLAFQYGGSYSTEQKADKYAESLRQGGAV